MARPRLTYHDPSETRPEIQRAYHTLVWDGILAQSMASITMGAFFTSYVLLLGASNTLVGVLNAAAPLTQVLQWPAAAWVVRARSWRSLTITMAGIGRSAWLVAAFVPWIASPEWRLPLLLAIISIHFVTNGVTTCAFNAWMRALVPAHAAGRFFGHRSAWAMAAGVLVGTLAGFVVQWAESGGHALAAYAGCILFGTVLGLIGLYVLRGTPDATPVTETRQSAWPPVPPDARRVFVFLGLWSFSFHLAQPFVMVYLLNRIGLGVGWAMALSMGGQALIAALYPAWGRLSDRYSNRAVLRVACAGTALSVLLWPVAAHAPGLHAQVFIAVIAMLAGGAAQSGALLCCYLLTLKTAPAESPAGTIAQGNFVAGLAALAASASAGWVADSLDGMGVRAVLGLSGLDVVFVVSAAIGLGAAAFLATVREPGQGRGRDVLRALFQEII